MKLSPTVKKILIAVLIVAGITAAVYTDAVYIEPQRITVRHEKVESWKIDKDLDGLTVCYFADLHYGTNMNKERASRIVDTINEQKADVVIFLGDLFDHPAASAPSETAQNDVIELLSQIEAPYGKFAVYGDHDLETAYSSEIVNNVYFQSGFEVMKNTGFDIHLKTSHKISFVALDCELYGTVEPYTAFMNASDDYYTVVLCHTPDTIDELDEFSFDMMMSAHSHGGQIYIPLIGAIYVPQFAYKYNHGKYYVNNHLLDITNGVGTTKSNIRFMAPNEIVIYRFYSK